MNEEEKIIEQLEEYKKEHRSLDAMIDSLTGGFDQIRLQRLKKRKLFLKDQIQKLEGTLHPDIIA